jgi:hypothetical protein
MEIERGLLNPDGTYAKGFDRYGITIKATKELTKYFLSLLPVRMRELIERGIVGDEPAREKFMKIAMGDVGVEA